MLILINLSCPPLGLDMEKKSKSGKNKPHLAFYEPPACVKKTSSEIINEARAAITQSEVASTSKTSSTVIQPVNTKRPYTPRDGQRTLFGRSRGSSQRPPSSFRWGIVFIFNNCKYFYNWLCVFQLALFAIPRWRPWGRKFVEQLSSKKDHTTSANVNKWQSCTQYNFGYGERWFWKNMYTSIFTAVDVNIYFFSIQSGISLQTLVPLVILKMQLMLLIPLQMLGLAYHLSVEWLMPKNCDANVDINLGHLHLLTTVRN